MVKSIFYHAGGPVCVEAEQQFATALNPSAYEVEVVHLGEEKHRISEAESAGVKSVPHLVVGGTPFHINYGASIKDLSN